MKNLLILVLAIVLISCSRESQAPQGTPARVVPLYSYFAVNDIPDSDSIEAKAFLRTVSEQPFSRELIEAWSSSQSVAVFTPDVDSVFTDSMYVPMALGHILACAESEGLSLPRRRYASVVYGRPESVLFVDSVMLIALNHYLGADYPGYSHWPAYMRSTKTPGALPYDLAEALVATSYPYSLEGEEATALSRMVYEGVLAHVRKAFVAGSTEAGALGYSEGQMSRLAESEREIWRGLVRDQLLYDTSMTTIDRLVSPSPEVTIVTPAAPGRVGRYIGYRIVERYLANNPDTKLPDLLSPDFYRGNKALVGSGYGQ